MTDEAAARREWMEEDRAMRNWLPEPAGYGFRPAPRKTWWQRLVDWWRVPGRQRTVTWQDVGSPEERGTTNLLTA
jgi:hypothetical protein